MVRGYPNGVTYKELPLEAQIIRVADEYDAITSKRQYKTHIDISDTLKILIDKTKPSVNDPKAKDKTVSKMNPKIVRALLKIVKIDIEYEIACVYDYVDHIKKQIKRLETVDKWYEEMQNFTSEKDKNYYLESINAYLDPPETIENYKTVLEEYKNALEIRKANIKSLYNEISKIKKMRC